MTYELIEWIFAALSNPEAGMAYLGSQGDIWDAQKDMLADTLGAVFAVGVFFWGGLRDENNFKIINKKDDKRKK